MFVNNLKSGILINLKEDEQTGYQCEIWFEYTRKSMELIREGAFLAAPNFSSNFSSDQDTCYTILEIVSILPIHYGLGENVKGYPGFIKEAAKSAFSDWTQQETEATEDTTQIRIVAIPTNLEYTAIDDGSYKIDAESNMPMTGCEVYLIDENLTREIANHGINDEQDNIIKIGNLIREKNVEVSVLVEELLQVHFGIFGFTGAGKSNLLSTLVAKLFQEKTKPEPLKIVFFDLMSEYASLSLDLLSQYDAYIIGIGSQTFPGDVVKYISGDNMQLENAANSMSKTSLLPKSLKHLKNKVSYIYKNLLVSGKIKVYQRVDSNTTFGDFINASLGEAKSGKIAQTDEQKIKDFIDELKSIHEPFTSINFEDIISRFRNKLSDCNTANAKKFLTNLQSIITESWNEFRNNPPLPPTARVTVPWLVQKLNNSNSNNLFIIQAHDPDQLRNFSEWLGNAVYEERRRSGQINPLVTFIFDEADEFIPQNPQGSYRNSSEIATTLARRGRKFGLGIGIATQRINYLETNILAQPHTYFVSKLPRKSDQEKIRDAFGMSEEMFRQTIKFKKGDWLLVSYDATGLEAVPLPIHTPNANERLEKFIKSFDASQKTKENPANESTQDNEEDFPF